MSYGEILEKLLLKTDEVYNAWTEASAQIQNQSQIQTSCKKGCGACCHFPTVPATFGEAFVLFNHLLAGGYSIAQLQTLLLPYADKYFAVCRNLGAMPFDNERVVAFMKEKLPCPLFTEQPTKEFGGHCSAFSVRPLICDYFHSTDSPELCAVHKPHGTLSALINRGVHAVDEMRAFERSEFGWSVLGHLPLLLAAFCSQDGLNLFLNTRSECLENEEEQGVFEFQIYAQCLAYLGYQIGENDLLSLEKAQQQAR